MLFISTFYRKKVARWLVSILVLTLLQTFGGAAVWTSSASASPAAGVGLGNGLQMFLKTEAGTTTAATSTPFNSGTCFVGVVSQINFSDFSSYTNCGNPNGGSRESITAYIRGYILAPVSETISFWSSNDDGLYVSINGTRVISNWTDTGSYAYGTFNPNSVTNTFAMTQGRIYPIEIQYHNNTLGDVLKLYWSYPSCSGCSTKATAQLIPQSQLGTSAADLGTDCAIGMSEACPANSAMEIKNLTNTNTDGLYWITAAGVSTQVYSLMNSSLGGGGWQLAMKGASTSSNFGYDSTSWTDTATVNASSPSRISTSNADAKYSTFYGTFANQMMALFPSYRGTDYGGAYPNAGYGFAWSESITGMSAWTAYDSTSGFGGNSYNVNMTSGPQGSGGCRTTPSTLRDMFASSNRCAIRQVKPTPSGTESYPNGSTASYYAAGNGLFATQKDIRFFGINYGRNSTSASTRARWGFGFNENGGGDEGSNDVLGGIGLGSIGITAGTYMGCCSATGGGGQAGVSGNTNGSSTAMSFELYVREAGVQFTSSSEIRVKTGASGTLSLAANRSGGSGALSWNIPQSITGISFNSSTGVLTTSNTLAIGTYFETATALDDTGAHATLPLKIVIKPPDGETDTAITLTGSQYLSAIDESTFDISNGTTFTLEAWVKPQVTNVSQIIVGKNNQYSLIICNNGNFGWNFFTTNTPAGSGDCSSVFGNKPAQVNTWQHVAIVRSAASIQGFVNGQLVGSISVTPTDSIKSGANPFVVGGYSTTDQPFQGQLDQVRVWSAARTQSEIQTGMTTFLPASQTGLIAAYGFNEQNGTKFFDSGSNQSFNTDLTINGTGYSLTDIKTVDTTTLLAYTIVKFTRSYLTSGGGYKIPSGVSRISALVVGGGGGGGARAGGGGGAGGLIFETATVSANTFETITVGMGGIAGLVLSTNIQGTNGTNSVFSNKYIAKGGGGGGGANDTPAASARRGLDGGSGGGSAGGVSGGGGAGSTNQSSTGFGLGNNGGAGDSGANGYPGGGGGGATGPGVNGTSANGGGTGGDGKVDPIAGTTTCYATGGGGGVGSGYWFGKGGKCGGADSPNTNPGTAGSSSPSQPTANTGSGGGGSGYSGSADVVGAHGASGVVIIRWITATVPIFTAPSAIDTTTETMKYTFKMGGSAISPLTRNFNWQYSTNSGTSWTSVQQSTSDSYTISSVFLSTSGTNFRYRVVVTDSDTAGLFIVDTSTTFSLTVNPYPTFASRSSRITKTINVSQSETFTITLGTPGYTYSLTPVISGITLDTSTVGSPVIKISETATVGTYYETLTATDSVTASVSVYLTIIVSAPPNLANGGEIVTNGQIFSIDSANSASYTPGAALSGSSAIRDISGNKKTVSINGTATYSDDYSGIITLDGITNYLSYTKDSKLSAWTIESYVRINSTMTQPSCVVTSQYTSISMNLSLCLNSNRTLYTGFYNANWTSRTTSTILSVGTWYHLVGTFNGSGGSSGIRLYINGSEAPVSDSSTAGGSTAPAGDSNLIFIGKSQDSINNKVPMSIGAVRIYDRALTAAEVVQNFNSTQTRFQSTKINRVKLNQKYGNINIDSFTVSSGSDTKTVSFQVGNRPGITWDTTTAGLINLSVQSSLSVGTYYDTLTVTDNRNASTYVPIKFTVTPADTITVVVTASPTSGTYNNSSFAGNLSYTLSGLVNSETGTVTTQVLGVSDAQYVSTCAAGGVCKVGDLAPGGGYVFYVSDKLIETGTSVSAGGIYLATAPVNWKTGTSGDPLSTWGCFPLDIQGTTGTLGAGASNTSLIVAAHAAANCSSYDIAARIAADLSITSGGKTYDDWFLPSESEVAYMYNNVKTLAGLTSSYYWTSQQATNAGNNNPYWAKFFQFDSGLLGSCTIGTSCEWHRQSVTQSYVAIRPIRAFSPLNLTTAQDPIKAGVYLSNYSFALTSPAVESNYQGVQVTQAALTINQANQNALKFGIYDAYPGKSTYPLNVYGGSGTGAVTRTLVSAGTAGCTLNVSFYLSATTVGTCSVRAVKDADRNYLPETTTATIYWIEWKDSYATQVTTGSHSIPIAGGTQIITHSETVTAGTFTDTATPTSNPITSAKIGDTIRIYLTGYSGLTKDQVSVTFRPMEDAVINSVNSSYIEVVVPTGAVTGVIAVDSPRGVAYTSSLTISP